VPSPTPSCFGRVMTGFAGFENAGAFKAERRSRNIPVGFMTGCRKLESREGFAAAAVE